MYNFSLDAKVFEVWFQRDRPAVDRSIERSLSVWLVAEKRNCKYCT